jgi:uncharacterized protein YdhG (YjbR/CyaY superfamily)
MALSSVQEFSLMDAGVQHYMDAIPDDHRPLYDRVHNLIVEVQPDVSVTMSYNMPTYRMGRRRLYVATWKHGVSLYGWPKDHDGGFAARHPELLAGKGTIRLTPDAAATISDDELRDLVHAALAEEDCE